MDINDEKVMVLGCDGYIGHALVLRLLFEGYKVLGIDNFHRRANVESMKSISATPIGNIQERTRKLEKFGDYKFQYLEVDREYYNLENIIKVFDPFVVVNLAQQPSAPFSQISKVHTVDTTINNLVGTINIAYAINEVNKDIQLIAIGSMGEYNPAVGIDIPEGIFDMEYMGKVVENAIFPRSGGSFYHCSKIASTYYLEYIYRIWDMKITDIMQGVVFGNWTPEIEETKLHTRLDSDDCFGTAVNRFIVQNILGEPLTIYGEGKHKRGFLAINDSIQCLMLAIKNPPTKPEYRTWNQLDMVYSMEEIAREVLDAGEIVGIKGSSTHIPSPRRENTSNFHYKPVVDKLKNLGFKPTRTVKEEALFAFESVKLDDRQKEILKNVVMPKVVWR